LHVGDSLLAVSSYVELGTSYPPRIKKSGSEVPCRAKLNGVKHRIGRHRVLTAAVSSISEGPLFRLPLPFRYGVTAERCETCGKSILKVNETSKELLNAMALSVREMKSQHLWGYIDLWNDAVRQLRNSDVVAALIACDTVTF